MPYADVFVCAVPTANRERYRQHADAAAAVFREYGALQVVECCGDDVPEGEKTYLLKAVKKQDDETVVFGVDTLPVTRGARRGQAKGDGRRAPERGSEPDAL